MNAGDTLTPHESPEGAQAMRTASKRKQLRRLLIRSERRWQRRSNAWIANGDEPWASLTGEAMFLWDCLAAELQRAAILASSEARRDSL